MPHEVRQQLSANWHEVKLTFFYSVCMQLVLGHVSLAVYNTLLRNRFRTGTSEGSATVSAEIPDPAVTRVRNPPQTSELDKNR